MSANGRWKDRMTEDTMMSVLAPSVPAIRQMTSDGTIATERVMMFRSHSTICGAVGKEREGKREMFGHH